jgi:nucleotide-binding universal stress UspA family protein
MSTRPLIVVAVDGSHDTESTVNFAAAIASGRAADLDAVQVVSRRGGLWIAPDDETRLRARLIGLRPSIEGKGVRFRVVTLRGTPESVVPAYAQLHAASLIVLGRNYGTSRLWRTSAVASRVSRSSPVPVIVVPTRPAGTERVPTWPLKRIVAAVDFTVASAIALRTATDVARRYGAHLTVFHALTWPRHMVFSGGDALRVLDRLPTEVKLSEERLKRKARAFGAQDVDPVVVTGAPGRGIIETAAAYAADLIVMGVAPRNSIDEAAFGSTLRAVLRRAETPVLVVPVVAGAHEWVDDVDYQDRSSFISPGAGVTRVAA